MSGSIDAQKRLLRTSMRTIRRSIENRSARADALWGNVAPLIPQDACVFAFIGVGTEPDTSAWIAEMGGRGIRVALPRVEGRRMVAVDVTEQTQFTTSRFGIPEPAGEAIDPRLIDAVIVPGLAFAADGRRLGQGGGYYDQFMPLLRKDCSTIGVCFQEQLVAEVPAEAHDRRVQVVVTDRGQASA